MRDNPEWLEELAQVLASNNVRRVKKIDMTWAEFNEWLLGDSDILDKYEIPDGSSYETRSRIKEDSVWVYIYSDSFPETDGVNIPVLERKDK